MEKRTIIICGATGQQGGAVLRSLIEKGRWNIKAITRNPDSYKANEIKKTGVDIIKADLLDKESLVRAFEGAYGVFGITQPWSPDNRKCCPKDEIIQGFNIIDVCCELNIKHLVITSMIHLNLRNTGVPHLDSKIIIEDYLRVKKINYTLFRLPGFMDNIGKDFFPIKKGFVRGLMKANYKTTYIACKDIGEFVSIAFEFPHKFMNKEMDLISDLVSGNELADILKKIRGEEFKYKSPSNYILKIFAKLLY